MARFGRSFPIKAHVTPFWVFPLPNVTVNPSVLNATFSIPTETITAVVFKQATVNASLVPSTQTNFPSYINLSRLGVTTLAEAQSIRVYSDALKTTELAREIVSVTEMHVKVSSLTNTFVIYVEYDGVRADYAVTDTYGRNAVWADYTFVYHLNSMSDSKGANTPVDSGVTYSAGKLNGNSAVFNGFAYFYTPAGLLGNVGTLTLWGKHNSATSNESLMCNTKVGVSDYMHIFGNPSGDVQLFIQNDYKVTSVRDTNWNKYAITWDTATAWKGYKNGSVSTTGAGIKDPSNIYRNYFGCLNDGNTIYSTPYYLNGAIDEVRLRTTRVTDNWETTEYNNQNNESSFWGTWTAVSTNTNVTVNPSVINATFSLPQETVITSVTLVPAVQNATFAIPAETVIIAVTILPTALNATFALPVPTISAIQNPTITPAVLNATFSILAESVIIAVSITPSVQNATFTLLSPTVTVAGDTTATPATLTANFALPAYTVTTTRFVTVTPSVINGTFVLPAYTVITQVDVTVSPNLLSATFTLPQETVTTTQSVTVLPSPVTATFAIPAYTVVTTQSVIVSPFVLAMTVAVPSRSILVGYTNVPNTLNATFSLPVIAITTTAFITITPTVLLGLFAIPSPFVRGDFWSNKFGANVPIFTDKTFTPTNNFSDKYPTVSQTFTDKVYNGTNNWNEKFSPASNPWADKF